MKFQSKFYLLIGLFISLALSSQNKKIDLTGIWKLTDYDKNESVFILSEDNFVSMSLNGEMIDGKKFIVRGGKNNGQIAELKYSINYDTTPIEIDLIAIKDKEEKGRLLGSIKPINENEFLMIWNMNGNRDTDLSNHNIKNIMIVIRK